MASGWHPDGIRTMHEMISTWVASSLTFFDCLHTYNNIFILVTYLIIVMDLLDCAGLDAGRLLLRLGCGPDAPDAPL